MFLPFSAFRLLGFQAFGFSGFWIFRLLDFQAFIFL